MVYFTDGSVATHAYCILDTFHWSPTQNWWLGVQMLGSDLCAVLSAACIGPADNAERFQVQPSKVILRWEVLEVFLLPVLTVEQFSSR